MPMKRHPNDAEIKAALSPTQVVAMTIWAEARAEPIEGEIAVGCVIRNRVLRPARFGETWSAVCLAKWQFSCWIPEGGEKNYFMLMERCAAGLAGTTPFPRQAMWIADGLINGGLEEDRVNGADHYYATWMPKPPNWSLGLTPAARIGTHLFFRVP